MGAIEHIQAQALHRREYALGVIKNVQSMSAIDTARLSLGLNMLAQHGRIAFHFHPDRIDSRGWPVLAGMLADGIYKTQFETRVSNGKLSPQVGGPRDHWENQLFGDCYRGARGRPKYGALDLGMHQNGPSARFGSCYLLSSPALLHRCTFSYLDSCREPREKGTAACFEDIFAALFNECFERSSALGVGQLRPAALVDYLVDALPLGVAARFERPMSGDLDHYIEAQCHGELVIGEDLTHLVADPAFKGTEMEILMQRLCDKYRLQLCWHQGYQMPVDEVPPDFRGAAMPKLAALVARDGLLDARLIGEAALALHKDPQQWRMLGNETELKQQLKLLWHVLVRFGHSR
ncbi:DUF3626 domain-containing protein [Shewanella indica]|uniref:DUF3626 domain-containing protein n=1 Tax=Shewanella indica TaxID=768528 RepID=UPI001F370645|nr:DUF3626 domain-containing protein [Shewanella indica]